MHGYSLRTVFIRPVLPNQKQKKNKIIQYKLIDTILGKLLDICIDL